MQELSNSVEDEIKNSRLNKSPAVNEPSLDPNSTENAAGNAASSADIS